MKVSYGAISTAAWQRNRSIIVSQKFPSSSPKRSFPTLVQFGSFSVPDTLELSFTRGRRFSWLSGFWAAIPVLQVRPAHGSCRPVPVSHPVFSDPVIGIAKKSTAVVQ
jgi:hypothetical protein